MLPFCMLTTSRCFIGLSASVIAILCMLLQLAISWKKCELGPTILWIGWEFHFRSGFMCCPPWNVRNCSTWFRNCCHLPCLQKDFGKILDWLYGPLNSGQPCAHGCIIFIEICIPSPPASFQLTQVVGKTFAPVYLTLWYLCGRLIQRFRFRGISFKFDTNQFKPKLVNFPVHSRRSVFGLGLEIQTRPSRNSPNLLNVFYNCTCDGWVICLQYGLCGPSSHSQIPA